MAGNRVVAFMEPFKLKVETIDYPKLANPQGKKIEHGAILKIVATNICGSDQHIYHGRFAAPQEMVMGHEMTGEVVEVGRDVEFIKMGDLCSGCARGVSPVQRRRAEEVRDRSARQHPAGCVAVRP